MLTPPDPPHTLRTPVPSDSGVTAGLTFLCLETPCLIDSQISLGSKGASLSSFFLQEGQAFPTLTSRHQKSLKERLRSPSCSSSQSLLCPRSRSFQLSPFHWHLWQLARAHVSENQDDLEISCSTNSFSVFPVSHGFISLCSLCLHVTSQLLS